MKELLAHVKTKAELTEYLASKTLEKGRQSGKCVVVAWSCRCEATHMGSSHLASNHEEANTKLLLHVVDATISGVTRNFNDRLFQLIQRYEIAAGAKLNQDGGYAVVGMEIVPSHPAWSLMG